jgi:transposase InsO family protein
VSAARKTDVFFLPIRRRTSQNGSSPTGQPTPVCRDRGLRAAGRPRIRALGLRRRGRPRGNTIEPYKFEIITPARPVEGQADVKIAAFEHDGWYGSRRLHRACHRLTQIELEQAYYSHPQLPPEQPHPTT